MILETPKLISTIMKNVKRIVLLASLVILIIKVVL